MCYVCVWQAKKIMEHKRKYERQREERELQKRKEKIRKAREAYEKQKQVWTPPPHLQLKAVAAPSNK